MAKFPTKEEIRERFNRIIEQPVLTSTIVLIILTLLVLGLSFPYYRKDLIGFTGQVLAEAHGMLFDIAVIGILIFWLNNNGERRLRIRTYKDEIDDFRLWESEEAAYRTVGNIKRLNRHKIYNINLVNCYLARTNLNYANLKDSNLNNANLSNANLDRADLRVADLVGANLSNANLDRVDLSWANLTNANTAGMSLKEAELKGVIGLNREQF